MANGVPSSGTDTVLTREAAWLCIATDALPSLLTLNGGPWDVIQAYVPRTPNTQQTQLYVLRSEFSDDHPMSQRYRPQHDITLKLVWPIRATTSPLAEQEQQAFDTAIDLLIQRIRGPLGDKTHGGAFLSAGQVPNAQPPVVRFEDPEMTMAATKNLRATISYKIDDLEFND